MVILRFYGGSGMLLLLLFSVSILAEATATDLAPARHLQENFLDDEQQTCLALCGVDEDVIADWNNLMTPGTSTSDKVLRILSLDTGDMDLMNRKKSAEEYFEKTGVKVLFDLVPTFLGVYDEIRSQLEGKLPLYDGFICGPAIVGTAAQLDGFYDLTDYVRENPKIQWLDVLRGFRENIAVYDNRVRMLPLDGDAHFMFYRHDVLDAFNLTVPRTWDEYWQTAKAVHGKKFKGREMVGSCVGMKLGAHLSFWTSLVLSSYTQTKGATEGFIMDAQDLTPLMGEAMAEVLKMLEMQATYGHPEVFETCGSGDPCSISIQAMNEGICALTYNWGDNYKVSEAAVELFSVAPTPGTKKVYNRKTKKLETCDEATCGGAGGVYYDDIGWVNRASYLAFGGWSAAVNNNIGEAQRNLALDFFSFMNGPDVSTRAAIPNATTATSEPNGVDPFRSSHLSLEKWVAQGYDRISAESYMKAVEETLNHPNAAKDMRFAGSDRIYSVMEEEVYNYLERAVLLEALPDDEEEKQMVRMEVANRLETRFRAIVAEEDAKAETLVPLLEQYQRDLGIYNPNSEDDDANLKLAITIPVVAALLLMTALATYYMTRSRENDNIWKVKREELIFGDPVEVIGSGSFGLVLLAEYRGTQVAVKRVLPPSSREVRSSTKDDSEATSGKVSFGSATMTGSGTYFDDGRRTLKGVDAIGNISTAGRKSTVSYKKSHRALKEDFIMEMRYLSKLRHPCITTVMGACIDDAYEPLLVMEYMDHGSLYDILHNETIPLEGEILLPMLCDITQGCRFLHAITPQVIHCDLKCANILVDSRFRAKVADFGLSQKQGVVTGTPFYMAPELLRREAVNNAATDVYSFGIILFEAFSRRDPYEGEDPKEVLKQVADSKINKRPPIPIGCPPQVAAIMNDCLLADPEARPPFEELDKRLRRVDTDAADERKKSHRNKATNSLFDIFPKHIAEALRDGKKVQPEHKDMVTIFFSDIVGFTTISSSLEPHKVANMLDRLYLKFDQLSDDHDVFKVETIGDAYMAVTNLVKDQANEHATRIAEFAIDAIKAAQETMIDEECPEKGYVNIRVGFHSGPVVADVVGSRSPRYCLFGDTVNTASRMESASVANSIHCSSDAVLELEKEGCRIPTTSRGRIKIKGKGEMQTFWVNTVQPESSQEGRQ